MIISRVRALVPSPTPAFARLVVPILLLSAPGWALDPAKRVSQYVHDRWTLRDGAPTGFIGGITQTPDGYLWIATRSSGLVRFDGVRFARATAMDELFPVKTDDVLSILTTGDGALWVGTAYGLARRNVAGDWELIDEGRSHNVDDMAELPDGTVVFARDRIGIGFVRNGKVTAFPSGQSGNRKVAAAPDGTLWLGTDYGLYTFGLDGTLSPPVLTTRVNALLPSHEGHLWAATRQGLYRLQDRRVAAGPNTPDTPSNPTINALLQDRERSLWLATRTDGVLRVSAGALATFNARAGLTDDNVTALYEDREGSLWIATAGGLDRLRDGSFVPFGLAEGLANDSVSSVLETRDGFLWTLTDGGGLNRIAPDGSVRVFTTRDGLTSDFGGPLYESRDGALWIGHDIGLSSFKNGRFRSFRQGPLGAAYIAVIGEDRLSLVVYVLDHGLYRLRPDGGTEPYVLADGTLFKPRMPFDMHLARDGTFWLATVDGLIAIKDGVARAVWGGMRSAVATSIHEDAAGVLWVGTWHGLVRIQGEQVTSCGVEQGLPHKSVYGVLEDRQGLLWLSCPRGIFRLSKSEVEDVAAGRRPRVGVTLFGYPDGMRTSEATMPAPPSAWAGRDHRLWFTTRKGLVAVDPDRLRRNTLPPPVTLEEILVDGRVLRPGGPESVAQLGPDPRRVELRYNGLSLLVPERVRFRFRLDGYDDDWVDGGTHRATSYTNLPPGEHVFHVTACNNDGVWNEKGVSVRLNVSPRWFETRLFAVLAVTLVLGGAIGLHRLRLRQMRGRERDLEQRVRERTLALQQEILERERAESALKASEERYELAIRGANEGIWDWNLGSDRVYFSPLWKSIVGYEPHEIEDRSEEWFSRVHPEDVERVRAKLLGYRGSTLTHYADEFRIRHKDGRFRWVLVRGFAVRDSEGRCERVVGAMSDVTERRAYDPLTGLPNRSLFMERLADSLAQARREPGRRFAVLFLDLDRFKLVNDSLGHVAGDSLLVSIARRLETCLRPGDAVARFPGDEFALLVEGVSSEDEAVHVAERVQQELSQPFVLGDTEAFASATIGIAMYDGEYQQAEEMLRDADTATHAAKARGRSRHEVFHEGMRAQVVTELELENALRRALERDELTLHYQPIASLETGRVEGFEALVRWNHPTRGLLLPDEFVPLAEETRLIAPLGTWVRRAACRQLHAWRSQIAAADGIYVSVNVSGREFAEPDLAREVRALLRETRIPPRRLRIEITETTLMAGDHRVAATLARLQYLKVALDIDDFGTGYSSLSYLQQLPVDALKIDQSFVAKLGPSGENLPFIQTMTGLARSLGLPVVAEGVETQEQLALLRQAGCDRVQGFLIARPLPPDEAAKLIGTTIPLPA